GTMRLHCPRMTEYHQLLSWGEPSAASVDPTPPPAPSRYPAPYAPIGGHVHDRFRSPHALSTRPTGGQYFPAPTPAGQPASPREYARSHTSAPTIAAVCGAPRNTESSTATSPEAPASISARIAIIASQNRSSSARSSDSVGSTINVPATGNDIVGAWNP